MDATMGLPFLEPPKMDWPPIGPSLVDTNLILLEVIQGILDPLFMDPEMGCPPLGLTMVPVALIPFKA